MVDFAGGRYVKAYLPGERGPGVEGPRVKASGMEPLRRPVRA
jgi:hypothetical protein